VLLLQVLHSVCLSKQKCVRVLYCVMCYCHTVAFSKHTAHTHTSNGTQRLHRIHMLALCTSLFICVVLHAVLSS
jgi:hypothetical protein